MFVKLLLVALLASANEEGTSRFNPPVETSSVRDWSADLKMELRSQHDQRPRPTNRQRQSIHEISAGLKYWLSKSWAVEVEISAEHLDEQSDATFFAKQAFVEGDFSPWSQVRAGQQFLPVGLVVPEDNWFSSNPPFYQTLFGGAKPVDLGFVGSVSPLAHSAFSVEIGLFSGQLVRESDDQVGSTDRVPRVVSLKSHSENHEAFLSYWEHDLAFFEPVRAWGAGGEVRSPHWRGLSLSLLGEGWLIDQFQAQGPVQRTRAVVLFSEINYHSISTGYRWSQAQAYLNSAMGRDELALEQSRLLFVQWSIIPELALRAERILEKQSNVNRDEWVARALVNWRL